MIKIPTSSFLLSLLWRSWRPHVPGSGLLRHNLDNPDQCTVAEKGHVYHVCPNKSKSRWAPPAVLPVVQLVPKIECGPSEPWVFRQKESVLPGSWDSVNNENIICSRNPFRFQVRKQELPLLKSSEALSLESSH